MITSLEIAGLRGIQQAKLADLRPLTVFVGPNGCGKSTVLEAAGVACAGSRADLAFEALATREWLGLGGLKYWCDEKTGASVKAHFEPGGGQQPRRRIVGVSSVFKVNVGVSTDLQQFARNDGEKGELAGCSLRTSPEFLFEDGQRSSGFDDRVLVINDDGAVVVASQGEEVVRYTHLATFADRTAGAMRRLSATRFSSALRTALTAIKLTPWYDDFVHYLRELRPNLDSIESIAVGDRDEPFIFEKNPRKGYPVAYAGDGFRRALLLAASLAEAKQGVAALDEPEAFAHPTMVRAMTRLFKRAQADGTQILISTHSLEFVATLLEELEDIKDRIAVVGLSLSNGVLSPMTAAGDDAYRRIVELRDDLRL